MALPTKLETRLLALVLALLLAALGATLITVSRATYGHTLARAEQELSYARRLFVDKLETRQHSLAESASTLAKDDALRRAIFASAEEPDSLQLALENHRRRTSADLAVLVDLDGRELADTASPQRIGSAFPRLDLLRSAPRERPERLVALRLGASAYQVVVVPYYVPVSAPQPSLWLLLGRALDDRLLRELRGVMGIEVAILGAPEGGRRELLASSTGEPAGRALAAAGRLPEEEVEIRELGGEEFLLACAELGAEEDLTAVLLRPTAAALLDYRVLLGRFLWIAVAIGLLGAVGALAVARGVTRPISALERAAQRLAAGDYAAELPPGRSGEVGRLAGEFDAMRRAVSEREAAIERQAFHDDLTGLPNRTRFRNELTSAIDAAANARIRLAVVLLDLDRFREINDTLGHHVGDRLLLEIARRLSRVADERGHFCARLGGDEFALLVPAGAVAEVRGAVERIHDELGAPIEVEELRAELAASAGIALYPDHGGDAATLLRQAEVAMYLAKERRLGVAFYDAALDRHSVERLSLVGDLRRAIAAGALELRFQPKLDFASGRVEGAEALVRWDHPRLGAVDPSLFVPLAEQTGLIRDLTGWVLARALDQLASWWKRGVDLRMAVNLSALDLHDAALGERIGALLAERDLPPERLVLEITESTVMAEPEAARKLLDEIAASGVVLAIDDFGTGYSSLAQLKRLPVGELKVDRSFVTELERSPENQQIVRTIIELGHNLGLRVVAEGVETRAALDLLREMGCDLAQGYFVGRPLSAPELERWLAGSARREAFG